MENLNETTNKNSLLEMKMRSKNIINSMNNKRQWTNENRYEENNKNQINKFVSTEPAILAVEKNSYILWILTPLAASFSVIMIIAALAGPVWLITEERLIGPNLKLDKEGSTMSKCTKSSLWIICSAILNNSTNCSFQSVQDAESYSCMKIDYFPKEEYRADAHDSTSAIPSGILFIVSGLLMLIGLIVYISIFKSEIGSKLRSKSVFEPPIFKFAYGQSFFIYVFGFIFTEFVGLLNIFLYISLLELKNNEKKLPCWSFIAFYPKSKNSSRTCRKLDPEFVCKKHAIPINLLFDSDTGKRYYFEKLKRIEHDSQNLAKSLNQLYTEPAPCFSNFDLSLHKGSPLTRSVSTTTEIFSENKKMESTKSYGNVTGNDYCGFPSEISRGIRKTKDDIINEFFKRTGVKPKSKNIYFIENPTENSEENIFLVDNYSKIKKNQYSLKDLSIIDSNASLKNHYEKSHIKSFTSLHQRDIKDVNKYNDFYFSKGGYYNDAIHQSQTLPRSFMKKNYEENQNYAYSQENSLDLHNKMRLNVSNKELCKSCEDMEFSYGKRRSIATIQWPQAIPVSPSYSIKSSNFYNRIPSGEHKKPRNFIPYFNNNYELSNVMTNESFDLDQIEKDCRVSHANLFNEGNYDTINGTQV
ncbi:uncharacterized protein LOC129605558 isoform X2 [Condylostylus longicornis]|uniref:uncharacterized protein LOC129605558 isoform X2 n=1 Tax=Condylostylus longicornis TaxID=2530218 RepID=UPI00244DE3F5|nr:uncharacterized protein LOC129605558 isoform X2 [Condylostylus longicornis]